MINIANHLLDDLNNTSFAGLDFPPGFILPAYQGQSILNIPATICEYFGAPPIHNAPLRREITAASQGDIQRIILVLMDGLALHRFTHWLSEGKLPVWNELLETGSLAPITSISPSTTSAAMTTLWTGLSAAEHGIAGYELWLKQYGMIANMIRHAPMSYKGDGDSLTKAGFDPEAMLDSPKLGQHLGLHGISAYSFQHYSIARSGLSRTFMRDTIIYPFGNEEECWVNLRQLIEAKQHEKLYLWTYWSGYDSLSHRYGPDDERCELYFTNFSQALKRSLIDRLSPELRKGTLLLFTADHGQVYTPKDPHYSLSNHPEFMNCLHMKPTGENRLAFLHVKPGKESTLREYVAATWPDQFVLVDSKTVLEAGLLGPGIPAPDIYNRLGDLTLFAKGDSYLWWSEEENPLLGRHGGLIPEEMLVPFVTVRL